MCQSLFFNSTFYLNLLKRTHWHRRFSVNFAKFLRTPFLIEFIQNGITIKMSLVFNKLPRKRERNTNAKYNATCFMNISRFSKLSEFFLRDIIFFSLFTHTVVASDFKKFLDHKYSLLKTSEKCLLINTRTIQSIIGEL